MSSTQAPTPPEQVAVVDLAAIDVVQHAEVQTATLRSTGEVLGTRPTGGADPRVAAAHLYDDVLANSRLWRDGAWRRVALYNPATARIAVGATPLTATLWAGGTLEVDASGTLGRLDGGEFHIAGAVAVPEELSRELVEALTRSHEAV